MPSTMQDFASLGATAPVGEIVRSRRNFLRMSRSEVAALAGCATRTLARLENDEGAVTTDVLGRILRAVGLRLAITDGRSTVDVGDAR